MGEGSGVGKKSKIKKPRQKTVKNSLIFLFTILFFFNIYTQEYSKQKQLDINNASLEEIQKLPVSVEM